MRELQLAQTATHFMIAAHHLRPEVSSQERLAKKGLVQVHVAKLQGHPELRQVPAESILTELPVHASIGLGWGSLWACGTPGRPCDR